MLLRISAQTRWIDSSNVTSRSMLRILRMALRSLPESYLQMGILAMPGTDRDKTAAIER
jgi:hypothetical protein